MAISDANRDRFRQIAASARGIPGQLGLRPYAVSIIVDNWVGDYVGGTEFFNGGRPVPITESGGQPPKVVFDNEDPLGSKGTCEIGPITPPYGDGGVPLSRLQEAVCADQAVYVLLTGPSSPQGARFAVKEVKTDKALHWMLLCEHSDFQPA